MDDRTLHTPRLVIRPGQRADLDAYHAWPPFADPLFHVFSYGQRNATERDLLWSFRQLAAQRRQWTVLHNDNVIGTIEAHHIDVVARDAELGMLIAAPYVEQGFGSEALRGWLTAYFDMWHFRSVRLDVDDWNVRARHVYDRLHFTAHTHFWRYVGDHDAWTFLDAPRYATARSCFRWGNDGVYTRCTTMRLEKDAAIR